MILVCPNCTSRFKVKAEALGDEGRTVRCAKCGHKWHAMPDDLIDPSDLKSLSEATAAPAKKAPAKAAPKKAPAKKAPPPPPEPEPVEEAPPIDDVPEVDEPEPDEEEVEAAPPPPPPMLDDTEPPPIPPEEDFVPRNMVPVKRRSPLVAWLVLLVLIILTSAAAVTFKVSIVTAYPPANKLFSWVGLPVDLLGHGLEISKPQAEAIIENDKRRLVFEGTIENSTDETIRVPKMSGSLLDGTGLELKTWVFSADKPEAFPGESVTYRTEIEDPPRGATNITITFKSDKEAMMIDGDESGDEPKQSE